MAENALAPDRNNALAQPSQWDGITDWLYRNAPEYLKESARALYEGPRNRVQGLWDEFKDSRLSGQTAAGLGSTLDPVRMLPGANSGMLLDIPRTMYLSRFGTQELPAGTDVYKYSNAEDAAGQRFARENPETAQTIGASMEAQFSHPLGMGFVPHAVSRGVDRAGNALAEHTPGPDQANMFIGPKARTWNPELAAKAEAMEKAGHTPDEIWKATSEGPVLGTFRGADAKPRQEIMDDNKSVLAAYPQLADVPTKYINEPGGTSKFSPVENSFEIKGDPSRYPDILAHEREHWKQNLEGQARGANIFSSELDKIAPQTQALKQAAAEIKIPRFFGRNSAMDRQLDLRLQAMKLETQAMENALANPERSFSDYRRYGGEVEANNVMNRLPMTPEERMLTSPWKTQDVPNEQQIVRFGNEGVQESRELPIEQRKPLADAFASSIETATPKTVNIPGVGDVMLTPGLDAEHPVYGRMANVTASRDGQVLGRAQRITTDEHVPNAISIGGVNVSEPYRRKGVASAIYDYVQGLASRHGADLVPSDLTSADAKGLWAKRRNEGVQESRNALGGQSIDPARRAEIQKWLKDQGIK